MGLPVAWLARALQRLGSGLFWTIPTLPTPSGPIEYATNDAEFTAKLSALSGTGGTIALDPAGTYAARTFSSNPSAVIWITSGTLAGGLVSQSLPAINYATNTRATIASCTMNGGVTNIKFHTLNFGSLTNSGDAGVAGPNNVLIYSNSVSAAATFPDLYLYNCELFGRPMEPITWSMRIRVANNSGFNVNDTITGATTGTTALVVAKISTNSLLIKNISAGTGGSNPQGRYGATDIPTSYNYEDWHGPFDDGENLNVGGSPISTYSAPYSQVTVASGTGFTVGDTVTGKTSLTTGIVAEKSGNILYLRNVSPRPTVAAKAAFTAGENLSITGAGGATVSTFTSVAIDDRFNQDPSNLIGTYGNWGTFVVQGCFIHDLMRPIQSTVGSYVGVANKYCHIFDSDFDMAYRSAIALANNNSTDNHPPSETYVAFNRITRNFGRSGEPTNPHANTFAAYASGGLNETWTNIYSIGNLEIPGFSRATFLAQQYETEVVYNQEILMIGNLFVDYNNNGTPGANLRDAQNCYIIGNVFGRPDPAAGAPNTTYTLSVTEKGEFGSIIRENFYEIRKLSGTGSTDSNSNFIAAQKTADYNTVFAGSFPLSIPTWSSISDRATILASTVTNFAYDPTGPLSSIIGLVDYTNKRLNLSLLEERFNFATEIDAAQSSAVATDYWRKHWPIKSSPINISGGEYRVSATKDTGASWTSSPGTVGSGEWVQARVTTASAAATATTATLTVGDETSTFTAITAPALSYTSVNNGLTATNNGGYAYKTGLGTVSFQRAIFAIRMQHEVSVASAYPWSDGATGSSVRCQITTGNNCRFYIAGSTNYITVTNVFSTSQMNTVLLSIDLTPGYAESATSALKVSVNGVPTAFTVTAWADTITSATLQNGNFGVMARGNATPASVIDGFIQFFWADWGDDTWEMPDIYDPSVYASFYKDLIDVGGTGYGPSGRQPKIYLTGTAAYWNGPTITNYGTLGDFTKGGTNSFS